MAPIVPPALLILSGLWLIIFFAALFAPPLLDDADATHANAARHMALTGDLVTLHVNGIRYLEKAPLPYWLDALSFRIFGFNTFAAHLPQAIAVLLLTLLGFRWADKAFRARTAFYTGLAILTSAGVFLFTRIFIPEVCSRSSSAHLYCFLNALAKPITIVSLEGGSFAAATASHQAEQLLRLCHVDRSRPRRPHQRPRRPVFFFGTAIVYLALTGE